jgi:hypothetical protein
MTIYHVGDIYIYYMHMIYRVIVLIQQYGLPEILSILSRVDAIPRDL